MPAANVFLSVCRTSTARQETFVSALEQLDLDPKTLKGLEFFDDWKSRVKGRAAAVPTAVETAG